MKASACTSDKKTGDVLPVVDVGTCRANLAAVIRAAELTGTPRAVRRGCNGSALGGLVAEIWPPGIWAGPCAAHVGIAALRKSFASMLNVGEESVAILCDGKPAAEICPPGSWAARCAS